MTDQPASLDGPTQDSPGSSGQPSVWLMLSDKLGDNAQVDAIVDQLGIPVERKFLSVLPKYAKKRPVFEATLSHLDLSKSSPLEPPWPDFVFTIGRRPSMAALWVRRQSNNSTRIILIGRPRRFLQDFELVVCSVLYRVPESPNVMQIALPLMRKDEAEVAEAAEAWRGRFASLARPLTAVLVGGPTKPFKMDQGVAARLMEQVAELQEKDGGTAIVTTSRRTPEAVVRDIERRLPPGAQFYPWRKENTENPYLGLLGLADRFIVTADSVSMMVEVARLGKPLAIFPLPKQQKLKERLSSFFLRVLRGETGASPRPRPSKLVAGAVGYSRDFDALYQVLLDRGLAVNLGDEFPKSGARPADELAEVVARVREVLAKPR